MRDADVRVSYDLCTRTLAELGLAGEALAAAAARGDVIAALSASHEARRLRAELARHPLPGDPGDVDLDLLELDTLVAAGRTTATIVDHWRARPLPAPERLVTTPLGVACLTDALLPATWDVSRDLVVLIGSGLEDVAAMLGDLGQQRVLAIVDPASARYAPPTLVVADATEASHAVRLMHECPPERVIVRSLDGRDPVGAQAAADAIHQALCDLRVHHNTISAFSATWIAQGARNLAAIARWPSVAGIGRDLAGVPMIICAPGPSLAGNVAQLRAARGRAVIVGFSHSLRALRAAGVVPDIVLTVDPQDVRYHFSPGDLDGVAAVVNGVTVHPALYELGAARYLTLASNGALDQWLYQGIGGAADVPGGGSVATTAMSLGLRWGCDPIITVGLDLSFPGGRYYVGTSCDGEARAVVGDDGTMQVAGWSDGFRRMKAAGGPNAPRERVVELPGWHGGTVPSSFMFAMFHRWFADTARRAAGTVRMFNCTEGGAFIDGMDHRPLADVLAELTREVDVAAVFDRAIAAVDGERDQRVRGARVWLTRTARELSRAEILATAGARLAGGDAVGRGDPSAVRRLERIEARLAALLARHDLVAMQAQRAIGDAFDEARRPDGDHLAATARLMRAAATAAADTRRMLARANAPDDSSGGHHG